MNNHKNIKGGDSPLTPQQLMVEACRLGTQSAKNNWGGPFGTVIAKDGYIVARGQNNVLLTGDITAHGEISAIRNASLTLNPYAPVIDQTEQNLSILEYMDREPNSKDLVPQRARMLYGMELYTSGFPCPMCMSAIYWARISKVYYACTTQDTQKIGFDDEYHYEDFTRPLDERRIPIVQLEATAGKKAYKAWSDNPQRHPY